jgi:Zn-dependent M28 family amino/carboxypeptidase
MEIRIVPIAFLLLFCLPFFLTRDERASVLKNVISIENLKQHVQNLQFDRNPYDHFHELEKAAQYIYNEFSKVGLRVWKESFQWEGKRFHNIVAEKIGFGSPDKIFILGAHYDTVPGSPGADDNASAIAVLLEVARNIQKVHLGSTLRLIAFSLEEYGYIGSTYYAERARREGEKMMGMISLEMVGFTNSRQNYPSYINPKYYPNVGDFIGLIGNERSKTLLEKVVQSFKTYIPQLPTEFLLVPGNGEGMEEVRLSDHSPFWDQGFAALMVTDTAFLRNPHYHLPSDTMETLDFEFIRKVAIGIFYSIVELAK